MCCWPRPFCHLAFEFCSLSTTCSQLSLIYGREAAVPALLLAALSIPQDVPRCTKPSLREFVSFDIWARENSSFSASKFGKVESEPIWFVRQKARIPALPTNHSPLRVPSTLSINRFASNARSRVLDARLLDQVAGASTSSAAPRRHGARSAHSEQLQRRAAGRRRHHSG